MEDFVRNVERKLSLKRGWEEVHVNLGIGNRGFSSEEHISKLWYRSGWNCYMIRAFQDFGWPFFAFDGSEEMTWP